MVKLEAVKVEEAGKKKEFHDSFLRFCTKMRTLCIRGYEWNKGIIIGIDNRWLLRKYPMLEHFELTTFDSEPIDEFQTFFAQNTNIQTFATNIDILSANRITFKNIQSKLNVLSILFLYAGSFDLNRDFLNELHARGLFKELHIYFYPSFGLFDQTALNQLISFNGLTKLFVADMENGTDLTPLIGLKQRILCNKRCESGGKTR